MLGECRELASDFDKECRGAPDVRCDGNDKLSFKAFDVCSSVNTFCVIIAQPTRMQMLPTHKLSSTTHVTSIKIHAGVKKINSFSTFLHGFFPPFLSHLFWKCSHHGGINIQTSYTVDILTEQRRVPPSQRSTTSGKSAPKAANKSFCFPGARQSLTWPRTERLQRGAGESSAKSGGGGETKLKGPPSLRSFPHFSADFPATRMGLSEGGAAWGRGAGVSPPPS